MKHYLLIAAGLASAIVASAASPQGVSLGKASDAPSMAKCVKSISKSAVARPFKSIPAVAKAKAAKKATAINPQAVRKAKAKAKEELPEGTSFFESFEDYDGESLLWAPEGWSIISKGSENLDESQKWGGFNPVNLWSTAADGQFVMAVGYAVEEQDEWLVMPDVQVRENDELSFYVESGPFFFFDTEKVDWDTMQFSEYVKMGDLEVLVKAEGEEDYTPIYSWMKQFDGWSAEELLMLSGYQKQTIGLNDYAGKSVSIAFRYYGKDCNSLSIDAVSIGYPVLDGVHYMQPFETLYWGFGDDPGWSYLNLPVAFYPVYSPLIWYNMSYIDDATYHWEYHDPITAEMGVSDDQDALILTYVPDFTNDFTKRNNLFYPPTLVASKPGAVDGAYTVPYTYMQAGGHSEFELTMEDGSKSLFDMTVFPFDHNTEGYYYLTVDDDRLGDMSLPVFGYNSNVDDYWINYTYNGETPEPGDYSHLNAIINFLYPSEKGNLVVEGMNMYAVGSFAKDADVTFEMQILPVNDSYEPDMNHPIASATCSLADVIMAEGSVYELLTIPFEFEAPVVLDSSETAYIIRFSGFRNEGVEYFAPVQSLLPNADGLCLGWLEFEKSITGFGVGYSFSPMANTEGPLGECYNAFAMGLKATYPYLTCDTDKVSLAAVGEVAEVNMESFYDAEKLTLEAAEGISCVITGRYNETVLSISADASAPVSSVVKISAPGVSYEINVEFISGVKSVEMLSPSAAVESVYTPDGRVVNPANAAPGVYVVKYTDGSVRKIRK